jgi:hypothetical protein
MDKLFLSILFLFVAISISAQKSMNFQYLHTIPVGEFQDNLMHRPSGIAFEFMFSPTKVRNLQLGASFSVSMYQNEDHSGEIAISSTQNAYVATNEDDCFYTYQGIARYYLSNQGSRLRPYLQGQIGGATFFSTLSLTEDPEDAFVEDTRSHGSAFLGGAGVGIAIKIHDTFYLDTSLTYNESSVTNYRTSPESSPSAQYRIDLSSHQERSKVNHLAVKLGMNMLF